MPWLNSNMQLVWFYKLMSIFRNWTGKLQSRYLLKQLINGNPIRRAIEMNNNGATMKLEEAKILYLEHDCK